MDTQRKSAVGAALSSNITPNCSDQTATLKSTKVRREGKLDKMLRFFARGMRFHRFQAERVGDHCLHTTVADLQARHQIYFDREFVKVPNRFGGETRVMRYWLAGYNLKKARKAAGLEGAAV